MTMFICFEGIAGSGKTTQATLLARYLKNKKGRDVFVSAAYEGSRRKLSAAFMNDSGIKRDQNAIMFLFQALHAAQHQEVCDALDAGCIVIADRWRYSFFAHHLYQKTFINDEELMSRLDYLAFRSLEPNIHITLNLPSELAFRRYINRERAIDDNGLELMDFQYFSSGIEYYKNIAHIHGWNVIDGTGSKIATFERIRKIIDEQL